MKALRSLFLSAGLVAPRPARAAYPLAMGIFTPIPVPPWVTERMEEKYCHKNDFRTPILPPIRRASRRRCARTRRTRPRILRAMPQRDPRRAVLLRGVPRRHPDRDRADRGQDRPAALLPAGRAGPAAPLPLEMHRLLHRDDRVGLPVPVPVRAAARPGGVHRPGPPAPVRLHPEQMAARPATWSASSPHSDGALVGAGCHPGPPPPPVRPLLPNALYHPSSGRTHMRPAFRRRGPWLFAAAVTLAAAAVTAAAEPPGRLAEIDVKLAWRPSGRPIFRRSPRARPIPTGRATRSSSARLCRRPTPGRPRPGPRPRPSRSRPAPSCCRSRPRAASAR